MVQSERFFDVYQDNRYFSVRAYDEVDAVFLAEEYVLGLEKISPPSSYALMHTPLVHPTDPKESNYQETVCYPGKNPVSVQAETRGAVSSRASADSTSTSGGAEYEEGLLFYWKEHGRTKSGRDSSIRLAGTGSESDYMPWHDAHKLALGLIAIVNTVPTKSAP